MKNKSCKNKELDMAFDVFLYNKKQGLAAASSQNVLDVYLVIKRVWISLGI